jgi:hypothetical protein
LAGRHRVIDLINLLRDASDADVPALAREALRALFAELHALEKRIGAVEAVIVREHKTNAVSRRLANIPGIGPITADFSTGYLSPIDYQHRHHALAIDPDALQPAVVTDGVGGATSTALRPAASAASMKRAASVTGSTGSFIVFDAEHPGDFRPYAHEFVL